MAQLPGVHREFVRAAMAAPFLEREEEHLLALRWRDDQDQRALDQLAASHMRLVIALASRFRHYGLPIADVIQDAVRRDQALISRSDSLERSERL